MPAPAPSNVFEITPADLARALGAGEPVQVVDVRAPARVSAGRIHNVPAARFHNIVGSQLITRTDIDQTGLDPALPVAVVCGHGNDSRVLAAHLAGLGFDARSLRGGMAAWMTLVVPRDVAPPASLDRLVQGDRLGKGALGYLLLSEGEGLIVDPPRDATVYLDAARDAGARIVGVADTHVHADYISGGPALARALGVPYYLHPADAVYPYDGTPGRIPFSPVRDGLEIRVGRAQVLVQHTPGHTEGSVTYVIDDAAMLTGDFLFVESLGRPDLAGLAEAWTPRLWRSVEAARRNWAHDGVVLPAHYASDTERRGDGSVAGPFGDLLARNEALRFEDEASFAGWVLDHKATFPDAYRQIKAINVGLLAVDDAAADELEVGRNECALGGR
jgi:glyoxylase-like metal-dependent hydrolase (beta-lactamase superfamily II)